jgi:hypothetical protein
MFHFTIKASAPLPEEASVMLLVEARRRFLRGALTPVGLSPDEKPSSPCSVDSCPAACGLARAGAASRSGRDGRSQGGGCPAQCLRGEGRDEDEYRAANTTLGTRYNTPVKDLPMNIEVLTSAFMRDIGALDVREALEYVSGIQLEQTTAVNSSRDNPENTTLVIRGISAGMKRMASPASCRWIRSRSVALTSSRVPAVHSTARMAPAAWSTPAA